MFFPTSLEEKLYYIHDRIHKAAVKVGRNPALITLVAVTKTLPLEIWEQAFNANLTTLGESRIQEAQEKSETFSKRDKIKLHLIGHLQSNKVRKAIDLFDVIQTVDSVKLAERINKVCKEKEKQQHIYIQVNVGRDPKKHGISIENVMEAAREISNNEHISLRGIMTIPANGLILSEIHSVYRKTREIRDEIYSSINKNCQNISMGMSSDYETAIAEGATHIRIGTGLFGVR